MWLRCSTTSRPSTTSPTTCSRWARTGSGAAPSSPAVDPQPGERVLDLAAGTGTSSAPFHERGAFVVPCDFSQGMLAVGKRRRPDLAFVAGDGLRLPFADASFDAVTISFGLRNLHDTRAGLAELLRVTRPGRATGGLRVQPPHLGAVPDGLQRVPHARPPARGSRRVEQPRGLRLPGRVDPGLARPAGAWPRWCSRPGGGRSAGATSPGASWPSTAAPPPSEWPRRVSRPCGGSSSLLRPPRGRSRCSGPARRRQR